MDAGFVGSESFRLKRQCLVFSGFGVGVGLKSIVEVRAICGLLNTGRLQRTDTAENPGVPMPFGIAMGTNLIKMPVPQTV
jgi:hypothetical protein